MTAPGRPSGRPAMDWHIRKVHLEIEIEIGIGIGIGIEALPRYLTVITLKNKCLTGFAATTI